MYTRLPAIARDRYLYRRCIVVSYSMSIRPGTTEFSSRIYERVYETRVL